MNIRALLLQARYPDDPMRAQEVQCFVERTNLAAEQIVPHNILDGMLSLAELRAFDVLMVGGSGDFYVSKGNLPHFEKLLDVLGEVALVGHPTFASCFGYQCMVQALGGEIIHDAANTEVGTYTLTLTDTGQQDPLFASLPATFAAQMGHKDRATRHPEGFSNLAQSERSPFQAFRVKDQPVWASQFHPELSERTNRARFEHYLDGYANTLSSEERQAALARFQASPEASGLLENFLKLVFY